MERKDELIRMFDNVDESQKQLIMPLIDEVVFLEKSMKDLKELPFIRIHPNDQSIQQTTPAAKQYKEMSQSYMNAIRILSSILKLNTTDGYDPVSEFLAGINGT